MLSEKDTPLPLVREWADMIPGVWDRHAEMTERIRNGPDPDDASEPELMASLELIREITPPGGSTDTEMGHAAFDLLCCAIWRQHKIVYAFDPTLAGELIAQADEWTDASAIPVEALAHPPYRCCFIAAPGTISPDFVGFFPYVMNGPDGVRMLMLCEVRRETETELGVHVELLHLDGSTVGDCVDSTIRAARAAAARMGGKVWHDKQTILRLINLYLYICAANADVDKTPPPTYRPRKQGAPIRDKYREVQTYGTGIVIGAALRRASASRRAGERREKSGSADRHVRAHTRRGHWHHFWTGPKSAPDERKIVLKWVAPMLIGGKSDVDVTTIHPVK